MASSGGPSVFNINQSIHMSNTAQLITQVVNTFEKTPICDHNSKAKMDLSVWAPDISQVNPFQGGQPNPTPYYYMGFY